MEDVRLGRPTGPANKSIAVPDAGNTPIAEQNPNRIALIITCPNAVGLFCGPAGVDCSLGQGHFLVQGMDALILDIQHHGTLVTQEWVASGNAAASSVTVLESILNEQ